jgi:hypothetical protein
VKDINGKIVDVETTQVSASSPQQGQLLIVFFEQQNQILRPILHFRVFAEVEEIGLLQTLLADRASMLHLAVIQCPPLCYGLILLNNDEGGLIEG